MALKVTTTPQNTVVKVQNNYPQATVKVVNNYGMQQGAPVQQTASPQQTAKVQTTYKPQTTATAQQINQAKVQADWAKQEAARLQAEAEARAFAKLQAKNKFNADISVKSNDWKAKVAGSVGLGGVLAQWRKRDASGKALEYSNMTADEIEQAIRHAERLRDQKIKEFEANPTQEKYNEILAWSNNMDKFFGDTIQSFSDMQKKLSDTTNARFTGRASDLGRGINKFVNTVGAPAKVAWKAGMWAVEQPSRLINTVKNVINPNNLRMYYDGTELKGGTRNIKWAYNASKDQRIVGRSKADEQALLEQNRKNLERQRARGGRNIIGTDPYSGFLRGNSLDNFRIKYGDDAVNLALDPLNWIGASSSLKARSVLQNTKFGKKFSEVSDLLKKKLVPNLSKEYISPSEKQYRLGQMVNASKKSLSEKMLASWEKAKDLGNQNNAFFDALGSYRSGKRITTTADEKLKALAGSPFKRAEQSTELRYAFIKSLEGKSDMHKALFIRGVEGGYKIPRLDRLRYVGKQNRSFLQSVQSDLDQYKKIAKEWQKADNITNTRFAGKGRGYLPSIPTGIFNPKMFRKRKGTLETGELDLSLRNREAMSDLAMQSGKKRADLLDRRAELYKKYNFGKDMQKSALIAMATELGVPVKERGVMLSKKALFDKMFGKVGNNRGLQRGLYRDARLAGADRQAIDANAERYAKILQKQKNKKRALGLPNNIWKAATTVLTPGWYVNNAVWNEIAGFSAGGFGFLKEQARYLNPLGKTARKAEKASLPKEVYSNIAEGINLSTVGRFGSKVENSARVPLYKALKKKGLTDEQALKGTNEHLFDYKTKNWDRPIKSVLPFWLWSKALTKQAGTMWYKNPRGASGFNQINRVLENQYKSEQSDTTEYKDEYGQTVKIDRKEKLKGKLKIGKNKWLDTAWLPFTPDGVSRFGVNPYIASAGEALSGENRFGENTTLKKTVTDRTSATRLMEAKMQKAKREKYFSESGYGKEKQGSDPTKSNYNKWLDPTPLVNKAIKSFFGVPNITTYDPSKNDFRDAMASFNKEFFAVDWDTKKKYDYKKAIAEQKAMAEKYGLKWSDVEKDWSKYDTPTAQNTKALKTEAYGDFGKFWDTWYPKKRNERNVVVRQYYKDTAEKANPYRMYPVLKGTDKVKGTADDVLLSPKTVRDSSAVQVGGKWFKSQASADRYFASRKNVVQTNGKFFKTQASADRYLAGLEKKAFWDKYYALPKNERKALLQANPKFNTFTDTPKTDAEWDLIKEAIRQDKRTKLRAVASFAQSEMNMKKLTVPPIKFKRQKKIAFKF